MLIQPDKAGKDRSVSFIIKGNSIEEIIEKVKKTLNSVKVLDVNGCELNFLGNYTNLLI